MAGPSGRHYRRGDWGFSAEVLPASDSAGLCPAAGSTVGLVLQPARNGLGRIGDSLLHGSSPAEHPQRAAQSGLPARYGGCNGGRPEAVARQSAEPDWSILDCRRIYGHRGLAERLLEDGFLLHRRTGSQRFGVGGYRRASAAGLALAGSPAAPQIAFLPAARVRQSVPARQSGPLGSGGLGHRRYVHAHDLSAATDSFAECHQRGAGTRGQSVPVGRAGHGGGIKAGGVAARRERKGAVGGVHRFADARDKRRAYRSVAAQQDAKRSTANDTDHNSGGSPRRAGTAKRTLVGSAQRAAAVSRFGRGRPRVSPQGRRPGEIPDGGPHH